MSDTMHSTGAQGSGPISQSVERLRREFERWVDAALQQGNRALDVVGLRAADRQWSPAVDLVETPTEIHIDAELPGVEPGVVDVSLAGNMLTIQGPKKLTLTPEGAISHVVERMHGPFQRTIPMPAPVQADSVTAELKNGVLRVRLLKSERARAQKIPVRSEPIAHRPHEPIPSVPSV
jgi:HSP20 family protein